MASQLLKASGDLPPWAVAWIAAVDGQALHTAPRMSARLLERVCAGRGAGSSAERAALESRLIRLLHVLGRDQAVVSRTMTACAQEADGAASAQLRFYRIAALHHLARHDEADQATDAALEDNRLSPLWRSRLEGLATIHLCRRARVDEARVAARRSLDAAAAATTTDSFTAAYALYAAACCEASEESLEQIDRGSALLGADPESLDLRMMLMRRRLILLTTLGRQADFRAGVPNALALCEGLETVFAAELLLTIAEANYRNGDWEQATARLGRIDSEFPDAHFTARLHGIRTLIALHAGDTDAAAGHFARMEEQVARRSASAVVRDPFVSAARTLRAEAQGDTEQALALAAGWLETPADLRPLECLAEVPDLVRLALAGDRAQLARDATRAAAAAADASRHDGAAAIAGLCHAVIDGDVDDLLEAAVSSHGRRLPLRTGFALEEAAVRLAGTDLPRARQTLIAAVRTYHSIGAHWDVWRANARTRELGVRPGPRSVLEPEPRGWRALTPRERNIAALISQGSSNQDIAAELVLSVRTVQYHVANILMKLRLRSRAGIPEAVGTHLDDGTAAPRLDQRRGRPVDSGP